MVIVQEVKSKRDLRKFARYPVQLYKNCPYYVPSFYADELKIMDPKKNFSLPHCEVKCFLAYRDGKIAGRGKHEELYEHCPLYREICDSQTRAEG